MIFKIFNKKLFMIRIVKEKKTVVIDIFRKKSKGELALKELDFKKLELELESVKEANRHQESAITAQVDEYSNSRNLQVEALRQDDKFSKRFIYYFAIFWSVFAVVYLTGITFIEIPKENVRFADTTVGFLLGTVVATLIGFFYGNSIKKG